MEFWSRAKRLRKEKRLSQAAVAGRMGTSQSWVARMESGAVDPGLRSVRRYLEAIGASLHVQPDSPTPAFRPITLTEMARTARRHIADSEAMLRLCLQFIDDYREAGMDVRASLLETAPGPTGDPRWDAFLGALAEHLSYHDGLPVPAWTDRKGRFLRQWWFLSDLPSVKTAALVESPAAFRRRGIFVTADLFHRA